MDTINQDNITKIVDNIYNDKFKDIVDHNEPNLGNLDLLKSSIKLNAIIEPTENDVWIFGYGSLMWKVDFPYVERRIGFIKGFVRRFYQYSIDHRGSKERPGRVVTLLPTIPADRVYGIAYRISAKDVDFVLKHLDYREKNGYERCVRKFYDCSLDIITSTTNANAFDIVVYIATPKNQSWAGDNDATNLKRIAKEIVISKGESGPNRQYLYNLASSMSILFPDIVDDHICELLKAVINFIRNRERILLESLLKNEILNILKSSNVPCDNERYLTDKVEYLLNLLHSKCLVDGWRESLYNRIPLEDI